MTIATFPLDPADMPALKRWLTAQSDREHLRPVDLDDILIGPDALLQLPAVLQGAGIAGGMRILLVMDETPMRREEQDLKSFIQALCCYVDTWRSQCVLHQQHLCRQIANLST